MRESAAIFLGISGKREEDVQPSVVEDSSKQEVIGERKEEDHRRKAA
jgi:hypothetical protein